MKLTPDRTDIIVQALEKGHSMTSAARLAGLHRDTLNRWMKRGRKGENGVFSHFYVTVQEALAKSEQKLVELVFNHAEKDWRAAAWLLSRRFPEWRENPDKVPGACKSKQSQCLNKRLAPLQQRLAAYASQPASSLPPLHAFSYGWD